MKTAKTSGAHIVTTVASLLPSFVGIGKTTPLFTSALDIRMSLHIPLSVSKRNLRGFYER